MKSYEWNLLALWEAQNSETALASFAESEDCENEKHSHSNIAPIDSAN